MRLSTLFAKVPGSIAKTVFPLEFALVWLFLGAGLTQANALPTQTPAIVEVVGDYAGRQLRLSIAGQSVADGKMPLLQPGETWRIMLAPPFSSQEPLGFEIAGCEPQSLPIQLSSGHTTTLIVDGCSIRTLPPE